MKLNLKSAEKITDPITYYRFRKPARGIERGTVIIGKRIIWGFPHIKRIFRLDTGIEKNIELPVYAEEKIDGFNVRVASVGGSVYGFSRGGFLDRFVTEKVREMKLGKFFEDHPNHVICGEMIGNTPFTKPTKKYDVRLLVFDIDRGDGSYIEPDAKYRMLREYGIEGVPVFGKFSSVEELKKLASRLNRDRLEGMVLKNRKTIKFVTANSDIEDIESGARWIFDTERGFFYQRILRSSFFIDDFSLDREEYEKKLGKALYRMVDTVRDAKKGIPPSCEFEILIRDLSIIEDIKKHMSRDVGIEWISRRKEGERTRVRFRKIYKNTAKLVLSYSNGRGITD